MTDNQVGCESRVMCRYLESQDEVAELKNGLQVNLNTDILNTCEWGAIMF